MKILLVEDEQKTIMGIAKLIMDMPAEYELVGQARSGEEGLQKAIALHPDLIITDIQMNKMSGLDMIQELKERKLECRYIILSGYAEFSYARRAITLGSLDYLLKPVTRQTLKEALDQVRKVMEEEERKIAPSSMRTDHLMEALLFHPGVENDLYRYELQKRIPEGYSLFLLLIRTENRLVQADWKWLLTQISVWNKENFFCVCREESLKEGYVLLAQKEVWKVEKLDELVKACREKLQPYIIFVGERLISLEELPGLREKLLDLVDWSLVIRESVLLCPERVQQLELQKYQYPASLEKMILQGVRSGDLTVVENGLMEFLDYFQRNTCSYLNVREAMTCLTVAILYEIRRDSYGLYENINNLNVLDWVKNRLFIESFSPMILNIVRQYEQYRNNRKSGKHPIIYQVLGIMEQEYQRDLSLEEMAERMKVTPEYLSALFMKELGIKYTTYRTQIRIEAAKELLQDGKLKIYEIAERCGFPDVKYFTKVFKKYTGSSPGEFLRK